MAHDVDKYNNPEIKQAFYQELSNQPYAGVFLFFLIFEDFSEESALIQKVFNNITDFDCITYLMIEKIQDPLEYYDANRILKLRDKLTP